MIPLRLVLRSISSLQSSCYCTPVRNVGVTAVCGRPKSKKTSGGNQNNQDVEDIDVELKEAAAKVATSLPGDPDRTASDLLSQLRAHAASPRKIQPDTPKPTPSLGDLFSGMKIEATGESITKQGPSKPFQKGQRPMSSHGHRGDLPSRGLFSASSLGIFGKRAGTEGRSVQTVGEESLWDRVDREELDNLTRTPPTNGFEEMIQWTQEGKLWHFSINNEQGMDEEAKYEFHDHIFLDDLLEEFPKKGPIRHFMELVTTGLSKNPFMTVPQKREHIAWFKTYFDEKQHILDDVIDSSQQQ